MKTDFSDKSCGTEAPSVIKMEPDWSDSQVGQDPERYKTELCRTFAEWGSCCYGAKCQFAHGTHELRSLSRNPKYKTNNCRAFHTEGFCPYGPRCHFVHNASAGNRASSSDSSSLSSLGSPRSSSNVLRSTPLLSPETMSIRYGLAHVEGTFDTFNCDDCSLTFSGYKRKDPRLLEHALAGGGRCKFVKAAFRERNIDLAAVIAKARFERGLIAFPRERADRNRGCRVCASPHAEEHYPGCEETISGLEKFLKGTRLLQPLHEDFLYASWSGGGGEGEAPFTEVWSATEDLANMVHVPNTSDCHRCESCGIDVGAFVKNDTLLGEHVYHTYHKGVRCPYLEERFAGQKIKLALIVGQERFRKGYLAFAEAYAFCCAQHIRGNAPAGVSMICLICGSKRCDGHDPRCDEMLEELHKRLETEIILP